MVDLIDRVAENLDSFLVVVSSCRYRVDPDFADEAIEFVNRVAGEAVTIGGERLTALLRVEFENYLPSGGGVASEHLNSVYSDKNAVGTFALVQIDLAEWEFSDEAIFMSPILEAGSPEVDLGFELAGPKICAECSFHRLHGGEVRTDGDSDVTAFVWFWCLLDGILGAASVAEPILGMNAEMFVGKARKNAGATEASNIACAFRGLADDEIGFFQSGSVHAWPIIFEADFNFFERTAVSRGVRRVVALGFFEVDPYG